MSSLIWSEEMSAQIFSGTLDFPSEKISLRDCPRSPSLRSGTMPARPIYTPLKSGGHLFGSYCVRCVRDLRPVRVVV